MFLMPTMQIVCNASVIAFVRTQQYVDEVGHNINIIVFPEYFSIQITTQASSSDSYRNEVRQRFGCEK